MKLLCCIYLNRTLQRPFKNLPPTGKAIPPPKISDPLYQSKAAMAKQASAGNVGTNATNGTTAAQQSNAQQQQSQPQQTAAPPPPSSPPLPPPPEQATQIIPNADYAVTEL